LPITAFEGIKRQKLYRENGLEVIFLPKRIDFTGKKAPWFAVAWFTNGLNIGRQLTFSQIENYKDYCSKIKRLKTLTFEKKGRVKMVKKSGELETN